MRVRIVLPKVTPEAITVPTRCVYAGCGGRKFHLRQEVAQPLRDTVYQEVQVHRYQCLKCKRTYRVYPEGANRAQTGASGERAHRDAVSAGVKLWSDLLSVRSPWGVAVQESHL
jgi:hypothetical protein